MKIYVDICSGFSRLVNRLEDTEDISVNVTGEQVYAKLILVEYLASNLAGSRCVRVSAILLKMRPLVESNGNNPSSDLVFTAAS